jgi:hypothetical protein
MITAVPDAAFIGMKGVIDGLCTFPTLLPSCDSTSAARASDPGAAFFQSGIAIGSSAIARGEIRSEQTVRKRKRVIIEIQETPD